MVSAFGLRAYLWESPSSMSAGAIAVGLAHFRRQALARIQLVLFREPAHTCLDVVYKALFVLEESDDLQSCVEQRKKIRRLPAEPEPL